MKLRLTLRFCQMEAEQHRLQNELQRQSDNYNAIATRHDREHREDDNLVAMLRSDVERLAGERYGSKTWYINVVYELASDAASS